MDPLETLATAGRSLVGHKLRSLLTMLGMVFGVGAVIAMLSIGGGAEREAMAMIERLGLRNVLVRAKALKPEQLDEVREKSLGVSFRDAEAIREAVPGVELTAGTVDIEPYQVQAGGLETDAEVFGVSRHHARLANLRLAEGRFLDALDERRHAQVCVIGSDVRRDLFGFAPALGRTLKINDVWLEVVGVLEAPVVASETFQGVAIGSVARRIFLPVTTAMRKFDRDPLAAPLAEIVVRLAPGTGARESAVAMHGLLDRLHAGADDFELVIPEVLLEQSRRTQRLFNIVMGSIAAISLLVGGIGIMNIMLATVLERTREIGVRRAVGARRRDILLQFVTEAFTISLVGGVLGILAGVVIARLVAATAGWQTLVEPGAVVLATAVAMTVGLVSGIYPAKRAADLDPIDALRYE